ncbi:MAG: hypothetical protein WCK98_02830 [bacterium]
MEAEINQKNIPYLTYIGLSLIPLILTSCSWSDIVGCSATRKSVPDGKGGVTEVCPDDQASTSTPSSTSTGPSQAPSSVPNTPTADSRNNQVPETSPGLYGTAIFKEQGCYLTRIKNDTGFTGIDGELIPDGAYVGVLHCAPPETNPGKLEGPFVLDPIRKKLQPLKLNCPEVGTTVYQPAKGNQQDRVETQIQGVVFEVNSTNSDHGDSGSPFTTIPIQPNQKLVPISQLRGVLLGKQNYKSTTPTQAVCKPFVDPTIYQNSKTP